jgi:hypothetical protein
LLTSQHLFIRKDPVRKRRLVSLTTDKTIQNNWENRKPGYRDGVVLVPVGPDGFFSSVVTLMANHFHVAGSNDGGTATKAMVG